MTDFGEFFEKCTIFGAEPSPENLFAYETLGDMGLLLADEDDEDDDDD